MSRASQPGQPPAKKKSAIGRVLSTLRRKDKADAKPQASNPVSPPEARREPPPPRQNEDPFQIVKERIAQARRELDLLTTYAFAAPRGITDRLQQADAIVGRATQPEQFADALRLLNEGQKLAPAIKAYAEDRTAALAGLETVNRLPCRQHRVLADSAGHIEKCVESTDRRLAAVTDPPAIDELRTILQGVVATLVPQAVEVNKSLAAAEAAITKAETALEPLAKYPFLDLSAAQAKIDAARAGYDQATTVEAAVAAVALLKGFDADLKAAKSAGKDALKAAEKYASRRKEFMDELAAASKLRGASTDPELKDLIDDAKTAVALCDGEVAAAQTAAEIENAAEVLAGESGLLKKCEARAKQLKEQAEADNKAIPKFELAYQQLKEARAQIATLPGATAQLDQCDKLLALHRITTSGEPAAGYAEALAALKGQAAAILAAAEEASRTFATRTMTPEVQSRLDLVNAKLEVYGKNLPAYRTESCRATIAAAASDADPQAALRKLDDIARSMDEEIVAADQLRTQAMAKTKATFAVIKQLKEAQAPLAAYEALEKSYNDRVLPAMTRREFDAALPLLDSIEQSASAFLASFQTDAAAWEQAKVRLAEIEARCNKLLNWPPLAGRALNLRDDVQALRTTTDAEFTYKEGTDAARLLEDRLAALNEAAQEQNLGDNAKIDDFAAFRANRRQGIDFEKKAADDALRSLEARLAEAGIKSVQATAAHQRCAEAYATWLKALDDPRLNPGEDPKKVLAGHYTIAYEALRGVARLAADIAADPTQLQAAVSEAKKADNRAVLRDMFHATHRMLNEMEALGRDVSRQRVQLAPKLDDADITAQFGAALMALHKSVKLAYDQEIALLNSRKEASRQRARELSKSIQKHADKDFEFKDYFAELAAQVEDAEAMLAASDPALVAAAEQELAALAQALDDTAPDKSNPDKKTFRDVVALWKQISKRLGEGERMKKRMPVTYGVLRDKLNKTIADAKKLAPADAMNKLTKVGEEIELAAQQAEVQDELYKRFALKFKEISRSLSPKELFTKTKEFAKDLVATDKITEVKKRTNTKVTDKTSAYWAQLETRLAEVEETARTEGHIHVAFQQLEVIERELDALLAMDPADARVALQAKDAEATQEQRMLRDMCRQWEREIKYFNEKVLPETEQALKTAKVQDTSQISDLKKGAEWATKSLEPYLNLLSAVPHKKLGANPSPDISKAASAFGQARRKLDDLVRAARRLAGNPEGTNVDFEGSLKKVQAEWADRAGRLAAALDALAREVEAVPGQADGDPNNPATYLAPDDKKTLAEMAPKLARSLRDLGRRIQPAAFDKPLAKLTDKQATQAERLAAREEALRTMRQIKADLVENKLVQALFAMKNNPFRDVRAEFGLVRAGLKKIEIEVLVGV